MTNIDPSIPSISRTTESEAHEPLPKMKIKASDTIGSSESPPAKVYNADIENPRMPSATTSPEVAEEVVQTADFNYMDYLKRVGSAQLAVKVVNNLIAQHQSDNVFKRGLALHLIEDVDHWIDNLDEIEWLKSKIAKTEAKGRDSKNEKYQACLDALENGEEISPELSAWLDGQIQKQAAKGNVESVIALMKIQDALDPTPVKDLALKKAFLNSSLAAAVFLKSRGVEIDFKPPDVDIRPFQQIQTDLAADWQAKTDPQIVEAIREDRPLRKFDYVSAFGNFNLLNWMLSVSALGDQKVVKWVLKPTPGRENTKEQELYFTIALINAATITPTERKNPLYQNMVDREDLLDLNWHALSLLLSEKGARNDLNINLSA